MCSASGAFSAPHRESERSFTSSSRGRQSTCGSRDRELSSPERMAHEAGKQGTMLLPFDKLAYRVAEDRLLPSWLGAGDERFVAAVLSGVNGFAGLQFGEAEVVAPKLLA